MRLKIAIGCLTLLTVGLVAAYRSPAPFDGQKAGCPAENGLAEFSDIGNEEDLPWLAEEETTSQPETTPAPVVVAVEEKKEPDTVQFHGRTYRYSRTVNAIVTAYEPGRVSCGRSADGHTSIMKNAWRLDGVAIDPRAVSYGTVVRIPEVGLRVADDTGSAMRAGWRRGRYCIDVRVATVWEARAYGVRRLKVDLFKPVPKGKD